MTLETFAVRKDILKIAFTSLAKGERLVYWNLHLQCKVDNTQDREICEEKKKGAVIQCLKKERRGVALQIILAADRYIYTM